MLSDCGIPVPQLSPCLSWCSVTAEFLSPSPHLSSLCSGCWKVFTGNELAALFGWWMFSRWKENCSQDADVRNVYMLATTVSSKILRAIALKEGFHFEVSVGYVLLSPSKPPLVTSWNGEWAGDFQASGWEFLRNSNSKTMFFHPVKPDFNLQSPQCSWTGRSVWAKLRDTN